MTWFTAWRASRRRQAQEQRDLARVLALCGALSRPVEPEPRAGHVSYWCVRYWLRRMEGDSLTRETRRDNVSSCHT